ncbi:MAG: glycosyltransferase [Proteobacteria bacterium]|nr:glycosyltransferase [Pseudomonadota bacterium]MDA1023629.1 glycosyltransferase [Pseudomonadota bacterium]
MDWGLFLALIPFVIWIGLLGLRGNFWRADQRLGEPDPKRTDWPAIVAVIPARNEAETIGSTVASLLQQEYGGPVSVIVVDDNSDDATASAAGKAENLSIIKGQPLVPGWSGKLWAVKQGLDEAGRSHPDAPFVLLTDADISHDAQSLKRLVAKAEAENLDLVSLMVLLRCLSFWEKLLIPAFVFFFQKLFPFAWVNDPAKSTAAAAGGCMLVRRDALKAAGGIDAIKDRLIDDCALAAIIKNNGRIWLGLTDKVRSERRYQRLSEIWHMVSRTAFEQLNNSYPALLGAVLGMVVLYLVPPLAGMAVLGGDPKIVVIGMVTWWGLMQWAFGPTLRLYGLSPVWGILLPVSALFYTLMTIASAWKYWQGRGGAWKGRHYGPDIPSDG